MNLIDQNSAIVSLNTALVPSPYLIESRSEVDRLNFLANFASLINFYDHRNKVNGNWAPFLLKDPVFLMASISKTPFQKIHTMYVKSCLRVQKEDSIYDNENIKDTPKITPITIIEIINILFDQLIHVFHIIERWTYFLYKSEEVYTLKTYIIKEIKDVYAELLWAIVSLREFLFLEGKDVEDVNWYAFESYDREIWKGVDSGGPFWVILGLKYPLDENTIRDYYYAVKKAGDSLFSFFNSIIEYSRVEYDNVKKEKGKFPDTLLLRTFTKLLQIYENQINTLSSKHLSFYYEDILKQKPMSAKADQVYICTDLLEADTTFDLPKNTLFIAGAYEDTTPILFGADQKTSLNPASVPVAYTLYRIDDILQKDFYKLYLTKHVEIDTLKKNEDGIIESWKTFGTSLPSIEKKVSLGFCFASPILFLREATRNITIVFNLKNEVEVDSVFTEAICYLSTQDEWFKIPPDPATNRPIIIVEGKKVTVIIKLEDSDPPIEAFIEERDGIHSVWPMFRISFPKLANDQPPPEIISLDIAVDVKGVKTFQLYNDFGVLETKKPFQPFGPSPSKNQSFIIGSNEIFTKKVDTLDIQLNWDNLPPSSKNISDNFSNYYLEYNKFLSECYSKEGISPLLGLQPPETISEASILSISTLLDILKSAGKILSFNKRESENENKCVIKNIFYNKSFKVDFQLLQYGEWIPVEAEMSSTNLLKDDDESTSETLVDSSKNDIYLFYSKEDPATEKENLENYTSYTSSSISKFQKEKNPLLQSEILELSDTATSGFLRIQLKDPMYGFGLALYPQVVSAVALYNAKIIAESINNEEKATLEKVPNEPYSPTASMFIGNYTSSATYDFNNEKNDYPLECFYYSSFCNFKIYDSQSGYSGPKRVDTTTLPIFQEILYDGQLFITLSDLIAPAEVSFFFELTDTNNTQQTEPVEIEYTYLSKDGWKPLEILSDGTYAFSCSGIIKFNIPDDISNDTHTMPGLGTLYYISIGVISDNLDAFSETVFLKTNGIKLHRVDTQFHTLHKTPFIPSDTIQTTFDGIPEISEIIQPFSSFGGIASETKTQMDRRICKRIKTKDRLVTKTDYFRSILQEFASIYYVASLYIKSEDQLLICVVNKVNHWTDAQAFRPYVTSCTRLDIQNYLKDKTSLFTQAKVSNFKIRYIRIIADISVKKNKKPSGIQKIINPRINIFLAPWIQSNQEQVSISTYISASQIASFIKNQPEISEVKNIEIQISLDTSTLDHIKYSSAVKEITLPSDTQLFVPSLDMTKINYS